jgi:hypothetical protein
METEAREVEFEDALAEEKPEDIPAGSENAFMRQRPQSSASTPENASPVDQTPVAPPETDPEAEAARESAAEDLEILAPKTAAKEWKIGSEGPDGNGVIRTYIQQELSVLGFAQWTGLVGEFLDKAMSGENALTLNAILSPPQLPQPGQRLTIQSFQDADVFVHAIGKLVQFAPDFVGKSVCIWLDVPDYEWDLVRALMRQSPASGGMSHDMFQEILEIFIDQNYAEINRFFRVRQQQIRARWQARAKEASQSRSSKR